ncbi:hypothetical protein GYA49_01620 [Candidatus Beckwithbacteria bacterium]|nr:hypothetical protein [Candidatus Beckwithbacteria bacterium]
MEAWQAVQFSACLLFFLLLFLCVRSLFYWLGVWHDVKCGWSKLKKILFLPQTFQVHYQVRRFKFTLTLQDFLILIMVLLSSYLVYFDLLKIVSRILLIQDPQLLIVIFTFNLALLYLLLPFLVSAYALAFNLLQKMLLLLKMIVSFLYYQITFSIQSYFNHYLHFPL